MLAIIQKKLQIIKLRQKTNNSNFYGEVSCINKFSYKSMNKIFNFMKIYFKDNGRDFTWEILLNAIIKRGILKISTNNKNSKYWYNINKPIDIVKLKSTIKSN